MKAEYTARSLALARLKTGATIIVKAFADECGITEATLSTVMCDLLAEGVVKRPGANRRSGYVAVDPASIVVVMQPAHGRGRPKKEEPLHPLYAVFGIRKVEIALLNVWGNSDVFGEAA
jgi:DNA-binding Lrp family transcriptional regulator